MPHSKYDWADRVKAVDREYQAVSIAMEWLLNERPAEIAVGDIYTAHNHFGATYLIRLYSVFERAVSSYWRLLPGNESRAVDGDARLDEVGSDRFILNDVIRNAQEVRQHRNRLVHERIDRWAAAMKFEDARRDLLTYLDKLPESWG